MALSISGADLPVNGEWPTRFGTKSKLGLRTKTIFKRWFDGFTITALTLFFTVMANGQNVLQFTSVNATPEGAIQLHWASNTNEIYEIDYATSLVDTNTGTTTWNPLYTDYPSHGTNTFWLDTGDYLVSPAINHPKLDSARFYRVVLTADDTAAVEPTVAITSPSDGDTVSNTITVSVVASSPDVIAQVKLYVDGQEMQPSDNGTNFTINTCEWWNGQHTLFAIAKSVTHYEGIAGDTSIAYGHAVSSYVNLNFNNLITEVAFSQPYFQPSLGQTQNVTATFAANCNWTLQIQDVNSNTVRNASGSGTTMSFLWDGTGDGETNIPDDVYHYIISATKNGLSPMSLESASMSSVDDSTEELYVVEDGGDIVPLSLFPPNYDTNGLTLIEATQSDVQSMRGTPPTPMTMTMTANDSTPLDNTASSETTTTPVRPPTAPVKNAKGTFYVGYQDYWTPGLTSFSMPPISSGMPFFNQWVLVDGETSQSQASQSETFGPLTEHKELANGFATAMQNGGYSGSVNRFITKDQVTGGIFNQANVGLLCCHGSYGTSAESDGVTRSYLRFFSSIIGGGTYCRLDDCSFGAPGTNGLKWMAILACNTLYDADYNNLYYYGRLPINNDLHLLLSASTIVTAAPDLGHQWASHMLNNANTISQAWFLGGAIAYGSETNHITIIFRVAGWPDAFSEHLSDVANSPGTGNVLDITKQDTPVYSRP